MVIEKDKAKLVLELITSIIILYYTYKQMNHDVITYEPGVKFWYKTHRALHKLSIWSANKEKIAQAKYWELVLN
jgi:hypothetical protein